MDRKQDDTAIDFYTNNKEDGILIILQQTHHFANLNQC